MIRPALLIALFAALLFIPFLGAVHLFDWDEINFAESAREMLATGDYFHVQINYQPFWEKPPLFFWLQAASMQLFGINEFAARLPNALCGIATLLVIFQVGRRYFSGRFAWTWVLFMTGSFTPHFYFKSGIIDPLFNLFIFLSLYHLFLASQEARGSKKKDRHFALIGLFTGLGIITKGPVALLVLLLCAAVYLVTQRFRFFFSLKQLFIALLVMLAITSVWFINELVKNGPGVLVDFIIYQAELFTQPVAGHGQPWFYHPLVLLAGAFPASVFAIRGFAYRNIQATPSQKQFRLFMHILFWVVLILFSISTTKIVHYSSLCYLPLTFSAAFAIDRYLLAEKKPGWIVNTAVMLLGLLIAAIFSIVPLIETFKAAIIPYIKNDPFTIASLSVSAPWNGYEFIAGLLFVFALAVYLICMGRNRVFAAINVLLVSFSVLIPVYLAWVTPKIEVYTQGPAIRFYESLQGKDCYVETVGFKSYAQYFYARVQPYNAKTHDKEWLLKGDIDKPVYVVAKVGNEASYAGYALQEIGREGGFVFLKREPANRVP